MPSRIVVIGDIHGCLDSFLRVLQIAGLVDQHDQWILGTNDQLVICGDMVDEGSCSQGVIGLIRTLQQTAGNQVTALLGNHELLMLRALATDASALHWETVWSWAEADRKLYEYLVKHSIPNITTNVIRHSFQQSFITTGSADYPSDFTTLTEQVTKSVADTAARLFHSVLDKDGTLAWLYNLPVAKKSGEWGFFHGGPPADFEGGIDQLNAAFLAHLQAGAWDQALLEPYSAATSPIGTRRWMKNETQVDELLTRFAINRVAFGHSPGALNGVFGRLTQRFGKVFKSDTYFSMGTEGYLEIVGDHVRVVYTDSGRETYSKLYPTHPPLPNEEVLWPA